MKKIIVGRPIKQAAPKDLVKNLKSILPIYGAGKTLAKMTGLSYPTIKQVANTGLATKGTIDLLNNALAQIEA